MTILNRVAWVDLRKMLPGPFLDTEPEPEEPEWERESVGPVRYAPPRVAWTLTEPATPGLYFVKLPGGPCRVVEVYWSGSRLMAGWSDIPEFAVAHSGMFWSDHSLLEPT